MNQYDESITSGYRTCLICTEEIRYNHFRSHLLNKHNLLRGDYIVRFKFNNIRPLCNICNKEIPNKFIEIGDYSVCSIECKNTRPVDFTAVGLRNSELVSDLISTHRRRCSICNIVYSNNSFPHHLKTEHNITTVQYSLRLLNLTEIPKCEAANCSNEVSFISLSQGFTKCCSQKCALSIEGRSEAVSKHMNELWEDEEFNRRHSQYWSKRMRTYNEEVRDVHIIDEYRYLYVVKVSNDCIKVGTATTTNVGRIYDLKYHANVINKIENPVLMTIYTKKDIAYKLENSILDELPVYQESDVTEIFPHSGKGELRHFSDFNKIPEMLNRYYH